MTRKYVYIFCDGKADGHGTMKDLLGGKGSGLAEMTNAGLPVPPGFTITTEDEVTHRWNWGELQEVGVEDVVTDIHCVTHWSKLDMAWRGVPMDRLFEDVETSYDYVMVRSYGGYTTNLPLEDLLDGQAWLATEAEGEPLTPEHGGPARLLVPHLYFWKSAKWVRGMEMMPSDDPGFWEQNGYHLRGDPWREERYW